jgi:hypothetical protein
VRCALFTYTDLLSAGSDRGHGLPVEGLEPTLQPIELESGSAPRAIGESPQDVQGIAKKVERLHAIEYIGTCIVKQIGADAVDQFVGRFN